MKIIYRYDETVPLTHLKAVQVENNYVCKADELPKLPLGFLTPAQLVNGKLVSATKEQSDNAAAQYLANHPAPKIPATPQQVANMQLMKQVMTLTNQNMQLARTTMQLQADNMQQKQINLQIMKSLLHK